MNIKLVMMTKLLLALGGIRNFNKGCFALLPASETGAAPLQPSAWDILGSYNTWLLPLASFCCACTMVPIIFWLKKI